MKIRTDFVTNSSSSSFTCAITVTDKSGNTSEYEAECYENMDSSWEYIFTGNLKSLVSGNPEHPMKMATLEELKAYLLENVREYWDEKHIPNDQDEDFLADITSIDDIISIEITREYSGWGECAELVADNDEKLCRLANRLLKAKTPDKKEQAEEKMMKYINTPSKERFGDNFARRGPVHYVGLTEKEELYALAERLVSNYGPNSTTGREYMKLDVTTGEYEEYSEFDLK